VELFEETETVLSERFVAFLPPLTLLIDSIDSSSLIENLKKETFDEERKAQGGEDLGKLLTFDIPLFQEILRDLIGSLVKAPFLLLDFSLAFPSSSFGEKFDNIIKFTKTIRLRFTDVLPIKNEKVLKDLWQKTDAYLKQSEAVRKKRLEIPPDLSLFPARFSYVDGVRIASDNSNRQRQFQVSLFFPIRRDLVEPKRLPPSHPAYDNGNGMGLFARINIPKKVIFGEYSGNLVSEKQYQRLPDLKLRDVFCMGAGNLNMIDGYDCGNEVAPP